MILVEMLDQILPVEDKDVVGWSNAPSEAGIEISTGTPVENVEAGKDSVRFTYGENSAEVDYLVIAGGRRPDVDALGLDAAGVKLDENGRVAVDGFQGNDKGLRDR